MFGSLIFGFFPYATISGDSFSGQVWFDQCKSMPIWEDQTVEVAGTARCQNAT